MGAKTGVAPKIRKLKLRRPDLTHREIAKRLGTSHQNVHGVLATFLGKHSDADLRSFQDAKADVYDALQMRVLASVTPSKLEKAPAVSLITGAAILEDKARLIRGLATGINVTVLLDAVEMMRSKPMAPNPRAISSASDDSKA